MWAWSNDSDIELLIQGLIATSYALGLLAVLVWSWVFLDRAFRLRQERLRSRAEEELTDQVLRLVPDEKSDGTFFNILPSWRRKVLDQVLLHLVGQTKGHDHERLLKIAGEAGFEKESVRLLKSADTKQRMKACVWLGWFGNAEERELLKQTMDDPDSGVRFEAAHSLLKHDAVPSVRWLLAKLDPPEEDPPLRLADIFHHLPPSLRSEAVRLLDSGLPVSWTGMLAIELARNQVEKAFFAMRTLINSHEDPLRVAGWLALCEFVDPRAAEWLPAGLIDSSAEVRIAVCRCAATVGNEVTMPLLRRLLGDEDWWVRYHAANALAALGAAGRELIRERGSMVADPAGDVGLQVLRERKEGNPDAS